MNRSSFRKWIVGSFIVYLFFLSYLLFFSNYRQSVLGILDYNLVPFKTIINYMISFDGFSIWTVTDNFFGNIAAFIPFGFFLPVVRQSFKDIGKIALASSAFSFLIETAQILFRVGSFDVDDVILNTIGGLIGYFIYRLISRKR